MLLPPSRSVVFNKNITNNDGLLAGELMQADNLNYAQANNVIENFVSDCKAKLEKQRRLELPGLGILFNNTDGNILFEQAAEINFSISAFGLFPVSAVKIETKAEGIKPKNGLQYRVDKSSAPKRLKIGARLAVASSLILLVFTLVFFATKQQNLKGNLATLNIFSGKEEVKTVPSASVKTETKTEPKIIEPDTAHAATTAVVKPKAVIGEWYEQPFQIVMGCFSVKQNAYKLIYQLEKQHLQADIAGKNAKGLYIVSSAGFDSETDARRALAEIKTAYPQAWLLKR